MRFRESLIYGYFLNIKSGQLGLTTFNHIGKERYPSLHYLREEYPGHPWPRQ